MRTVIALAFLVLFASALRADNLHDQPAPGTNTNTNTNYNTNTNTNTQAAGKGPGFLSVVGDPYGNDKDYKRTCFQSPCFEPVEVCPLPRVWQSILYVVPTSNYLNRINGGPPIQTARFVGYQCVQPK